MANTWNQVGTLQGPQGPRGEQGLAGAKGGSVRIANIDVLSNSDVAFSALSPSDGVQVGDSIVDTRGDVYVVSAVNAEASSAHVGQAIEGVTLKGPQGPAGPAGADGAPGKDGTSVSIKGTVADKTALPTEGVAVGDTYVTTTDGHMWVWSGSEWTDLGKMQGPAGQSVRATTETPTSDHLVTIASITPAGATVGDSVVAGDGALYTVTAMGDVHATLSSSVVSLKGPKGETGAPGKDGAAGAQGPAGPGIIFGQGAPTEAMAVGTTYVDTSDGFKVYQYGNA